MGVVDNAEYHEALNWIDESDRQARLRRHARAADCSFKRTYIPEELQAVQKPLDHYLYPAIQEVEALKDEREELTRW